MVKRLQILKAKKGFTLVELIVVIAIIGVLAAILIPTMLGYVTSSRVTSVDTTASTLKDTVANAIVETDAAGHKVPRSGDYQVVLTGAAAAGGGVTTTVSVNNVVDPEDAWADTNLKDLIEKKIAADYNFTKAYNAIVVIHDGKVSGAAYVEEGTLTSTDWTNDVFASGKFAWGGDTPGIKGNDTIGTAPKLQLGS